MKCLNRLQEGPAPPPYFAYKIYGAMYLERNREHKKEDTASGFLLAQMLVCNINGLAASANPLITLVGRRGLEPQT